VEIDDRMVRAFYAGKDALWADPCPYPEDTAEWRAWLNGHMSTARPTLALGFPARLMPAPGECKWAGFDYFSYFLQESTTGARYFALY